MGPGNCQVSALCPRGDTTRGPCVHPSVAGSCTPVPMLRSSPVLDGKPWLPLTLFPARFRNIPWSLRNSADGMASGTSVLPRHLQVHLHLGPAEDVWGRRGLRGGPAVSTGWAGGCVGDVGPRTQGHKSTISYGGMTLVIRDRDPKQKQPQPSHL